MSVEEKRKKRFTMIILAYPICLVIVSAAVNFLILGVEPSVIAMPSRACIIALVIAAILLVLNHIWLMTSTELTRLKYNMHATPEEWDASGVQRDGIAPEGWHELERRHNAHRNLTENTTHFTLLALIFCLISPTIIAAQIWIIGFAAARLGYTFCYLNGRDGARGLFMSFSLIAMYGLASYLVISLFL